MAPGPIVVHTTCWLAAGRSIDTYSLVPVGYNTLGNPDAK